MTFRNSVTIVASPRPRVGKTLLARLLMDFHHLEGRTAQAFDLGAGETTLTQFLPDRTVAGNVADIPAQMALFDGLIAEDGINKVVDLGAAAFESFFAVFTHIGFSEEAHRRGIATAILFFMTPDATSYEAYRSLGGRLPKAALMPVHNEILGAATHRDYYPATGGAATVVRIPLLAAGVRKYVERPPFSFADDAPTNVTKMPLDTHVELQHWLRKINLEFREMELRILLADLRASVQLGS